MTGASPLSRPLEPPAMEPAPDEGSGMITGQTRDKEDLMILLKSAMAAEMSCALRYKRYHLMAIVPQQPDSAPEFLAHSNAASGNAKKLAKRILKLGGDPLLSPVFFADHDQTWHKNGDTLSSIICANMSAERITIESYKNMMQHVLTSDETTRRLLEELLEWKIAMLTNWLTCWWHCLRSENSDGLEMTSVK